MPTSKTWNGVSYSVPSAGERNWPGLNNFLIALADSAQTTVAQKVGTRVATTTPVTVSATADCVVVTALASPGAVTVNLPAGVAGQVFMIVDGTGDAGTNAITVTPAAGLINGASTYVINRDRGAIIITYNGTAWSVVAEIDSKTGQIVNADVNAAAAIDYSKLAALTASRALESDGDGVVSPSSVTSTELGYLAGVTSSVQDQIDGKRDIADDVDLTSEVTGALPIANGGTGETSANDALNALLPTQGTNSGKVLTTDGTDATWQAAATVPSAGAVYSNGTALLSEAALALTRGGTAKSLTAVSGGLVYSDADSMEITAAGTAQNWVLSGGTSAPTMSNTTTRQKIIDGSADEIQLLIEGHSTQLTDIIRVRRSDGTTILLQVTDINGTTIRGTTTNDSASSGFVGELLDQRRLQSAATGLTSATAKDVLSTALTITAGDWQIGGVAGFTNTGNSTRFVWSVTNRTVNTTPNTLPASAAIGVPSSDGELHMRMNYASFNPNDDMVFTIPTFRVSLSTSKDFQLTLQATFSTGTSAGYGYLFARRVR